MPIRIKCPSCQTILGVKEALAGKKANCPKCRHLLIIPVPKPKAAAVVPEVPSEELDALAASAFADEPPPPPKAASTQVVEFECVFCMEMVKVSADLAGKQTPCPNPECKRIIKVPLPKPEKAKDWREANPRLPSGAMKKDADQPEGAWSTAQKTRVSTEALLEANAIPVKRAVVPVITWVKRGVAAAVIVIALIGGTIYMLGKMAENRLQGPMDSALAYVEPENKVPPMEAAAILRGAGEFYAFRKNAAKANDYLVKARSKLIAPVDDKAPPDPQRDVLLIEIALAFLQLTVPGADAENEKKTQWTDVADELRKTLAMLNSDESTVTALREICGKLIAMDQTDRAMALVGSYAELPAEPAAEKTEKLVEKKIDKKEEKKVDPDADPDEPKGDPKNEVKEDKNEEKKPEPKRVDLANNKLLVEHIALLYATGQAGKVNAALPLHKEIQGYVPAVVCRGHAEGNARKGNYEEAREIAKRGATSRDRVDASCGVALVALDAHRPADAKPSAEDAVAAYHDLKKTLEEIPDWLVIQLVRVCARSGLAKEAKEIATTLPEKAAKGTKAMVQLEMFLGELDATSGPVPISLLDAIIEDKSSLVYGLGLERMARHNTHSGQHAEMLAQASTVQDANKPFVLVGVAVAAVEPGK